jgi:acetoacetyl-CoA synthetase
LKTVRALGTTGSPLSADVQNWGGEQFAKVGSQQNIWWANISGGTDFAGAFIGGNRELPLIPGEMQCRILGCAVEAWDEQGEPVIGEVGELVCTFHAALLLERSRQPALFVQLFRHVPR